MDEFLEHHLGICVGFPFYGVGQNADLAYHRAMDEFLEHHLGICVGFPFYGVGQNADRLATTDQRNSARNARTSNHLRSCPNGRGLERMMRSLVGPSSCALDLTDSRMELWS